MHIENSLENQLESLYEVLANCDEWLFVRDSARGFALSRNEIEIEIAHNKLLLTLFDEKGLTTWRIDSWKFEDSRLTFEATRNFRKTKTVLELIPRLEHAETAANIRQIRLKNATELAEIARKHLSNFAKIDRIKLLQNRLNIGRIAKILLETPNGKYVAVCGSVVGDEKTDSDELLASSIIWFEKLRESRKTFNCSELWLVIESSSIDKMRRLHALLDKKFKPFIKLFYLHDSGLSQINPISLEDLWLEKPKKFSAPRMLKISRTALEIITLSPNEIDLVRSKHGETLRFSGLPFARIRKLLAEEKCWFGVEKRARKILHDSSMEEFAKLLEELKLRRNAKTENRRNSLFQAGSEAWLEAILRRDVSRLEPNLILAPIHAQFRAFADAKQARPIDLLAIRTDGRLVVIELKTNADREHVFQAIEYWRTVELQRRNGNLQHSRLFGDLEIADQPPLVYLVAPLMSHHENLEILASKVTKEIEIWRFDLNENWREGVKVARSQPLSR